MIKFKLGRAGVVVEYQAEMRGNGWVWRELKKRNGARISNIFRFLRSDLVTEPFPEDQDTLDNFTFQFRFASSDGEYYRIPGRHLRLKNDVLIVKTGLDWERKLFVAERNISIFLRISKLIPPGTEIVIGGSREDAIPVDIFAEMLKKFPNKGELDRYASARVSSILGEYIDPRRDFRAQYEAYLNRRKTVAKKGPLRVPELLSSEIEKFVLIRDTIRSWLASGERSEEDWQKMLIAFLPLIFPKYVAVLEKVPVEDHYSKPGNVVKRQIDLALVDVNGNVDVIEIKKPFNDVLLRKTLYRDNFVPTKDLSGTIMQAEKYLFHLGKWGLAGEEKLTAKYSAFLPGDLKIRITNPKALLILGRDRKPDGTPALEPHQLFDLEVIKRKYANMIDIITYDDLLRRLENIIASLERRSKDGLDATAA
jgi:hypothetical protein